MFALHHRRVDPLLNFLQIHISSSSYALKVGQLISTDVISALPFSVIRDSLLRFLVSLFPRPLGPSSVSEPDSPAFPCSDSSRTPDRSSGAECLVHLADCNSGDPSSTWRPDCLCRACPR